MTHLSPTAVRRAPSPASLTARPLPALLGDRSRLLEALATKRAEVASLEAAWVSASEADAARAGDRKIRMDDRSTWDKATWERYLAAAATHEPDFKPRIMRLLREIDNLEALLAMPSERAGPDQARPRQAPAA